MQPNWTRLLTLAAMMVPALALGMVVNARSTAPKAGPKLAHMVFFTLKDQSAESVSAFVASCDKYLSGHPGVVHYSVGTIAKDVVEPVSDRDFDVALHLIFEGKSDADTYQKSDRHVQFVNENKAKFAKVRVFDSYLAPEVK